MKCGGYEKFNFFSKKIANRCSFRAAEIKKFFALKLAKERKV